uniref:Uncharacterized protein n=1 Tax=Panagrolaimus sp. PS1159 TaxID=55785 RepID=A0AC35G6M3_9BILA
MEKFAVLMNEFEEKKIPAAETLGNLEKLFIIHPKFTPSDVDLTNMFNQLGKILQQKETKAISRAISLMKYFTKDKKYHLMIFKTDILKNIAPHLHSTNNPIIHSTLDNFINIATTIDGAKAIIDSKVLKYMLKVFEIQDEHLSYKSLQLLSKFSDFGEETIKEIFKQDKNLFFFMVNHLDADYRPSRIPAFNSVVNTLAHANEELTHGMIDMGCVSHLCNFFYEYSGNRAMDTFKALKNTLEKSGSRAKEVANSMKGCGGIDYLMEMNTEESQELIYKFFDY